MSTGVSSSVVKALAAVLFTAVCTLGSTPPWEAMDDDYAMDSTVTTLCNYDDFQMCLSIVRNSTIRINFHSEITDETCRNLEKGIDCLSNFQEACDIENKIDFTKMIVILENSMAAQIACVSRPKRPPLGVHEEEEDEDEPEVLSQAAVDPKSLAEDDESPKPTLSENSGHSAKRPSLIGVSKVNQQMTTLEDEHDVVISRTAAAGSSEATLRHPTANGGTSAADEIAQRNFEEHALHMHTTCYSRPEIKRCEDRFSSHVDVDGRLRADEETCRHYRLYEGCVENVIIMKCDLEEHWHLEHYLIEHAKFLVWKCPEGDLMNVAEAHFDIGTALSPIFRMRKCVEKMKGMFAHCRKNLHQNLEYAARMTTNATTYVEKKCCAVTEFFGCSKVVVLLKCGLSAGKVVVDAIEAFQEHENAECKGYEAGYFTRCTSSASRAARLPSLFLAVSLCTILLHRLLLVSPISAFPVFKHRWVLLFFFVALFCF